MLFTIFKDAWFVFFRSFRFVLIISLFVNIPRNAIIMFIPQAWLPQINLLDMHLNFTEAFASMVPLTLVMYVVAILFEPLAIAGLVYVARKTMADEDVEVAGILDNTLQRWPAIAFTACMFYVALVVGSMLFVLPGLYVMVVFTFYTMVVVERGMWGVAALIESARIVKGHFLKTAFVILLIEILRAFFGNIIGFIVFSDSDVVNRLANTFMFALRDTYVAYFSIVLIMYYFMLVKPKENAHVPE
ncbi:MAG: hypothetical protein FWD96_00075 [Defluviitaleaceae bacterium]|nr:hypothetical protein [Defluviitaleaceae bacterium]